MRILTQSTAFAQLQGPIVLAAGFFDGVHLGHRQLLHSTLERAGELGGEAWVLTFAQHPLSVLAPAKAPPLLSTLEQRLELFKQCGMHGVLLLDFTPELANLEPGAFIAQLCGHTQEGQKCATPLYEVRCGRNWRFGRRAVGTPELLARLGRLHGFRVLIVPFSEHGGVHISSTRIRCAIQEGRMDEATAMLGRPYAIKGTVVHGRGIGRTLQVATANIIPHAAVLPPNGVYIVAVDYNAETCLGVANLGICPTFAGTSPQRIVLETHLLDFQGDLYGAELEVRLLERLRAEISFTSVEELKEQIARDIGKARDYAQKTDLLKPD